ncbi:LptF/LptG family permease [Yunchengibacter salinarum]|uniref:LptF/LptG family permease n=1 Tax=Yunchengibacter salinarum TaxID=3133399 RepID=UPI0035B66482
MTDTPTCATDRPIGPLRQCLRFLIPSRTLAGTLMRHFAGRVALLLLTLVVVLQSLDLLNRSDDILASGAGSEALLRYVRLRLPELISQFTPFAVLLASLFSLAGLAQSSEITVMRATGLTPTRILMPFLLVALGVAALHMLFHDQVTVPASRTLAHWQDQEYAMDGPDPSDTATDVWLDDGHRIVQAEGVTPLMGRVLMQTVTVFRRGADGLLDESLKADLAIRENGRWTLYNVRRFDLADHRMVTQETAPLTFNLPEDQLFARLDRPAHLGLGRLWQSINALESAGVAAFSLKTALIHRIAQPLAALVMPLLAAFVGFSMPRRGGRILRVVAGLGLGFGYFVLDSTLLALGTMGVAPSMLAGAGATLVFFLIGASITVRAH